MNFGLKGLQCMKREVCERWGIFIIGHDHKSMSILRRNLDTWVVVLRWGWEFAGLPRSWKSPGISGILKIYGISGKDMEFRLKLTKVMGKSWNFEIRTKSHGIWPKGTTFYKSLLLRGNLEFWILLRVPVTGSPPTTMLILCYLLPYFITF